jgi:16S rRNA (uracil1498-N3)-methyltransferase
VTAPLHAPVRHPALLAVGERLSLGVEAMAGLRFREVRVAEAYTLLDAAGRAFRARLLARGEAAGEALVFEAMARPVESPLRLVLVCAALARERMFWVIQKATELGVAEIWPILTDRSLREEELAREKAHAWPAVARRASKQCRRASVPIVHPPGTLVGALDAPALWGAAARLYLDDRAPGGREESSVTAPPPRGGPLESAVLVAGPEGGWSEPERALLADAGARPLALGGRVLRAETAALVGVTLLQSWWGDLTPSG